MFVIASTFFSLLFASQKDSSSKNSEIVKLLNIPSLAYSRSYLEERIPIYKDATNVLLNTPKDTFSSFVYVQ